MGAHTQKLVITCVILFLCIAVAPATAAVTLDAAGDHTYYFGEDIKFFGNTDNNMTFLFMIGPGLPVQGAQLSSDPKRTPVEYMNISSFSWTLTQPVNNWTWTWPTHETIDLEPSNWTIPGGNYIYNYQVFAVNQPVDFFNLSNPGVSYATLNISLQWPFIIASASPYIGPAGTVFTFSGLREGSASPAEYVYISVTNYTTGGSLPHVGVNPDDFSIISNTGGNATLAQVWVNADRTWSYDWDTSAIANGALLPGSEYRFYIMNKALNITDAETRYNPPAIHYVRIGLGIEGPVTADYIVNASSGPAPLAVEFTDISSGIPTNVSFDFGDGTPTIDISPGYSVTHIYTTSGTYTPLIFAHNSISIDNGTNATITVGAVSAFTYSISDLKTVSFYDNTPGKPVQWDWNFGDGETSTEQNPVHTYQNFGTFNISLTTDGGISYATQSIVLENWSPTVNSAYDAVIAGEFGGSLPSGISVYASPDLIPAGSQIQLWGDHPAIVLPSDEPGTLIFIDEYPGANWEHSCWYYYVKADGSYEKYPAFSPPTNFGITYYDGEVSYPEGANSINSGSYTPSTGGGLGALTLVPACTGPDCSHNYAFLLSGGFNATQNHIRYWNDISFMYQTLNKTYGYQREKIIVLMSDGTSSGIDRHNATTASGVVKTDSSPLNLDSSTDGSTDINGSATLANVNDKLNYLNNTLTNADNLFVFTTSHGGWTGVRNTSKLYLWNEAYINDTDFIAKLPKNARNITMVMEQCYSGGFVDNFIDQYTTGSQGRVVATAANGSEPSWGNGFSYTWTKGVAMIDDNLNPIREADITPADLKISMWEAYNYSLKYDPSASSSLPNHEHPQYSAKNPTTAGTTRYLSTCPGTQSRTITVRKPIAAEIWNLGSPELINWQYTGLVATEYVNISLWKGTQRNRYIAQVPATNASHKWTLPTSGLATGTDYWINVSSVNTPIVFNRSPNFEIKTQGSLGSIQVNTNPTGANITIDGVRKSAPTNALITAIAPGDRLVNVSKTGYYGASSWVKVKSATKSTVTFTLELIDPNDAVPYGSIHVTSSIPGAEIFIDNQPQGVTEATIELLWGEHDVLVKRTGYATPPTQHVFVPMHESVDVYFELTPEPWLYYIGEFSPPIDMYAVNIAKAGSNIPVMWHLSGVNGAISDPASFVALHSSHVECDEYAKVPAISIKRDEGRRSGLQYLGKGNWQYNWKTPKTYAGTCQEMYIEFARGQNSPVVTFKFT